MFRQKPKLGYTKTFWPYGGSGTVFPDKDEWMKFLGCGERTVINLVKGLSGGSIVTADRHFSSPILCAALKDAYNIHYNGTCMVNRKFFPAYTLNHYDKNHSKRGYWIWGYDAHRKVYTCSWLDREPVHFVSTAYSAAPGEVLRGYKKNKEAYKHHNTACPQMGVHYNVEMPGVDISNMRANANFYSVQSVWACRKWWKKYFAWLYDTARLNAAIC